MSKALNCPVCDRQEIIESICPNCETDLSPLRILAELPELSSNQPIELETKEPEIINEIINTEPIKPEPIKPEPIKSESGFRFNNQILLFILVFVISFLLGNLVHIK